MGVKRMIPSYRTRSITQRTILPNGTQLALAQYGPAVSTSLVEHLSLNSKFYNF